MSGPEKPIGGYRPETACSPDSLPNRQCTVADCHGLCAVAQHPPYAGVLLSSNDYGSSVERAFIGSSVMASAYRGRQVRNPRRASGEEARSSGRFRMRISAPGIGSRGFSDCGRRVLRAFRDYRAWCPRNAATQGVDPGVPSRGSLYGQKSASRTLAALVQLRVSCWHRMGFLSDPA